MEKVRPVTQREVSRGATWLDKLMNQEYLVVHEEIQEDIHSFDVPLGSLKENHELTDTGSAV